MKDGLRPIPDFPKTKDERQKTKKGWAAPIPDFILMRLKAATEISHFSFLIPHSMTDVSYF